MSPTVPTTTPLSADVTTTTTIDSESPAADNIMGSTVPTITHLDADFSTTTLLAAESPDVSKCM